MRTHPFLRALEGVPEEYDRARADYSSEAFDWFADRLDISTGRRVLDLAAGTGKLTALAAARGAEVVAVERSEALCSRLAARLPEVEVLPGGVEGIPLSAASVDVVIIGQAFHWFESEDLLEEIHRVLRADGGLGVIYNRRDPSDLMQFRLGHILEPLSRGYTWKEGRWRGALAATFLFSPGDQRSFPVEQTLDTELFRTHAASIGIVVAASQQERAHVDQEVRSLAERVGGEVILHYDTVAVACSRREVPQAIAGTA